MKQYLILVGVIVVSVIVASFVIKPVQNVVNQVQPSLGALSSPDINSPFISWGGVRQWASSAGFTPASQTLCAIQSPAATTTLVAATVRFDSTISLGAGTYELGWGAVSGATTTVLARATLPSAKQTKELVATTSITTPVLTDNVVNPSTWINLNIASGTVSTSFAPTGKCLAVFREL